jgi:hypothetical protein
MVSITWYLDRFAPGIAHLPAMDDAFFRISKQNGLYFLPQLLLFPPVKGGKMFNSLKYVKKLEEAGIPREQAETHIQIVTEIMETSLATKQDIKDLQAATKQDIKDLRIATQQDSKDLRTATSQDIKDLQASTQQTFQEVHLKMDQGFQNLRLEMQELRQEMKYDLSLLDQKIIQSEQRMTIKLGTIVSLAIGVAVALAKIMA